jgi:hypothetical protein
MTPNVSLPQAAPAVNTQNDPASTNGWDCVSVLRFPEVNKAIVDQKTSPKTFSQSDNDPTFGTISLNGNFSDWQLSGGDGKLVWIEMPMLNSVFTLMSKTHNYSKPMKANVEVNMLWIEQQTKAANSKGYGLKIDNTVTINVLDLDPGDNTEADGSKVSSSIIGLMKSSLQSWLLKNITQFDHVFASVDIAEKVDSGPLGWLKPTDKFYAVTSSDKDPDNMDKKLFAVLCMTENRENPGDHEVSPFAIPDESRAAFLISPERFLTKMMLNGMPLVFVGKSTIVTQTYVNPQTGQKIEQKVETWKDPVTVDDFTVDNLTITNKVPMRFMTQEMDDGKKVDPIIDKGNFNLRFQTNGLEMDLTDLNFEYSPGITVHLNHTAPMALTIDKDRKFNMVIGKTTTSASVVSSETVLVLEIVGSIAAAVLGAALGGFLGGLASGGGTAIAEGGAEATIETITVAAEEGAEDAAVNITEDAIVDTVDDAETSLDGIEEGEANLSKFGKFKSFLARNKFKIFGTIVGGAIGGSTGTIANIIKAVANADPNVPTIDELGTEALAPITWPNLEKSGFVIKNGGINGCLQIGFTIK